MSLFVDYVGLNTLITQEPELTTNTFNTSSDTRLINTYANDYAISVYSNSSMRNALVHATPVTNYLPMDPAQGMAISCWVNLASTNGTTTQRMIVVGDHHTASAEWAWYLEFRFNSIRLVVNGDHEATSSGNAADQMIWSWSQNMTDTFFDKWNHLYLDWSCQYGNTVPTSSWPNLWVNGTQSTTVGTLTSPVAGDGGSPSTQASPATRIFLFDHPLQNTNYELDGKMQNFALYNSSSVSRVTSLYQGSSSVTDLSSIDSGNVVDFWHLGNEEGIFKVSSLYGTYVDGGIQSVSGNNSILEPHFTKTNLQRASGLLGEERLVESDIPDPLYVGRIAPVDTLASLNAHRNGPYGYSTWKQLRVSENPISRQYKKNNTMTFVSEPGRNRNISDTGVLMTRDRYSHIHRFTEPVVTQKAYPLVWNVGRHFKDEDGNVDMKNPQRFSIISSYGNQQISFANSRVDRLLNFDPDETKTEYVSIKDMYLENGLNKLDSPLTHWEFIQYRETVFPIQSNQFRNQTRSRPQFNNYFRHDRGRRSRSISEQTDFGATIKDVGGRMSTWPLDATTRFIFSEYSNPPYGTTNFKMGSATNHTDDVHTINFFRKSDFRDDGILQSFFSAFDFSNGLYSFYINSEDTNFFLSGTTFYKDRLAPFPMYSRPNSIAHTCSVSNPSGINCFQTSSDQKWCLQYEGRAVWDAGSKREAVDADGNYVHSPKQPFYDTYDAYAQSVKNHGKSYSIIPEFRMSSQIEDLKKTGGSFSLGMFEVTGAGSASVDSTKTDFFEIFSNSDFLKNFEVIADDHKDFTNNKVLSLRCKAIKKFLPYEGFYPCQRTVQVASRFYDSFADNIEVRNSSSVVVEDLNFGKGIVMTPLFRPGILFNTIKSGLAVDYPMITGSLDVVDYYIQGEEFSQKQQVIGNTSFTNRIPFEALVVPKKYLSDTKMIDQEPSFRANMGANAKWDGEGDDLYSLMANNFLAETINFFLPNGQLTSLVSKKQKSVKTILTKDAVYGMRVKMRRSMNKARHSVFIDGNPDFPYLPPQDIIKTGSSRVSETFTMYSRPSAFGPPTDGLAEIGGSGKPSNFFHNDDSRFTTHLSGGHMPNNEYYSISSLGGFNFPFTPPYYHGESWCDIWITGSGELLTIEQIQSRCTASFIRYDHRHIVTSGTGFVSVSGPQNIGQLNDNAMQLSASLNIFGLGSVKKRGGGTGGSLVVDSALDENSRWVIQTKFETPMLNFNHISGTLTDSQHITMPIHGSGSIPVGMWHQYGRMPEEDEGVFIEVVDIPFNWQHKRLGKGTNEIMRSLSDILGFSGVGSKLGRLAPSKVISEAVVAVPFIEEKGRRKFFTLDKDKIDTYKLGLTSDNESDYRKLTNGSADEQIGRSVLNQIRKMKKYIFPPSFDFINFDTDKVTPVAMYIFEFSHRLTQTDLQDIWQNLPPDIATEQEESEVAITHPLLKKELLGPGGEGGTNTVQLPDKLRWMVFKVKQRASSNYFKKTVARNDEVATEVDSGNVTQDEFGNTSALQYNWPYDFFSLVEMVKVDAEIEMGNADFSNYVDNIPNWDPVQAEPEKIEAVVGGIEDDPLPEINPPDPEPEKEKEEKEEEKPQIDLGYSTVVIKPKLPNVIIPKTPKAVGTVTSNISPGGAMALQNNTQQSTGLSKDETIRRRTRMMDYFIGRFKHHYTPKKDGGKRFWPDRLVDASNKATNDTRAAFDWEGADSFQGFVKDEDRYTVKQIRVQWLGDTNPLSGTAVGISYYYDKTLNWKPYG